MEMEHIEKIRIILDSEDCDAILINQKPNKIFINSLTGSGVWILITRTKQVQIMDGRYEVAAKEYEGVFENYVTEQGDLFSYVLKFLKKENIHKLLVESEISLTQYKKLSAECDVKLLQDKVTLIRAVKDASEIEKVKRACKITDDIFNELLPKIKVGMTEKEVVGELFRLVYYFGAEGVSFDPVICSGPRSAMPHARASDRVIENGDFLLLDFGVIKDGYQSDMTRTVSVGEITDKFRNMYTALNDVQQKARDLYRKENIGHEIHDFAKAQLTDLGYGEYFPHGLGHGLGIGGGERPLINSSSDDVLKPGMIATCEPGIYIPGVGGIRIEDDVLVTENNPEILNKTTHEIISIG